jgi:hypothetical protein
MFAPQKELVFTESVLNSFLIILHLPKNAS